MYPQSKFVHGLPRLTLVVLAVMMLSACGSQPVALAPVAPATAPAAVVLPTSASESGPTATETASSAAASAPMPAAGTVSFTKDLAPIIENSCVSCHGGEKTSKGLDLKTYASLMAGSQNGAMLVPGDAAGSKLVQKIKSGSMPKRGTKWTADQLQLLVDWVNAGAQNN